MTTDNTDGPTGQDRSEPQGRDASDRTDYQRGLDIVADVARAFPANSVACMRLIAAVGLLSEGTDQDVAALRAEVERLKQQVTNRDTDISWYREQLATVTRERDSWQGSADAWGPELDEARTELATLRKRIADASAALKYIDAGDVEQWAFDRISEARAALTQDDRTKEGR
jgi:hypothetical protein